MATDKTTIGLTEYNRTVVEHIATELGWFRNQMEAAKFALALAIDRNIEPDETEGAGTVWNVGSFDPTGELRDLFQVLFPTWSTPYRLVEHFVNSGLQMLGEAFEQNPHLEILDLLPHYEAE